ncbi:hypothetical protein CRENBAI_017859, partial [Crenichthys baileyi]
KGEVGDMKNRKARTETRTTQHFTSFQVRRAFAPSSQSLSPLAQALPGKAISIDPIKLVDCTARLAELSPKSSGLSTLI